MFEVIHVQVAALQYETSPGDSKSLPEGLHVCKSLRNIMKKSSESYYFFRIVRCHHFEFLFL